MKEEQQLLDSYLDGELTPDEERRFAKWLAADAEHIRQFVRETSLHRQIRETMLARPYHVYGLSDVESAKPRVWQSPVHWIARQWIKSRARQVGRVTPCAPQTQIGLQNGAHGVTRPTNPVAEFFGHRTGWSLAAAAAILCVMVLPGFLRTQGVPELASITGAQLQILRGGQPLAAAKGLRLRPNDVIRTTGEGRAVINYGREATRIDLETNSELKLLSWKSGKRFDLRAGKLEATVARQRSWRPMILVTAQAEALVLGTKFTLTAATNVTRLEVSEGNVKFTRKSDDAAVKVPAGHYAIAPTKTELTALPQTGSILREIWTGIPGGEVNDLLDHPDYPNRPAQHDLLKAFETPVIQTNNYACRLIGYIHPPVTGDYTFWIASGGYGALWLSPDENPVGKVRIARALRGLPRQWWDASIERRNTLNMPQSPKFRLVAGRRYFIQAVEKTATNSSHLEVAWKIPGSERDVIPGEFLSPFKPKE